MKQISNQKNKTKANNQSNKKKKTLPQINFQLFYLTQYFRASDNKPKSQHKISLIAQ